MSSSTSQTFGADLGTGRAPLSRLGLALWADLLVATLLWTVAIDLGWVFPLPEIREFVLAALAYVGLTAVLLLPLQSTIGGRLVGVELRGPSLRSLWREPNPMRWTWIERKYSSAPARTRLTLAISAFTLLSAYLLQTTYDEHPASARGETLIIPTQDLRGAQTAEMRRSDRWIAVPFFYAMGSWPRKFDSQPVLLQIPYRPGVPKEFITSIVARWRSPDVRLTIEGPRTPDLTGVPQELHDCILASAFECLSLRRSTVARHIREMRALGRVSGWNFGWFDTADGAGPLREDRAQGIFIRATLPDFRIQERYILVNAQGRQQALILDRPSGEAGEPARALLYASLTSIQVLNDLGSARAYTDALLETVHLEEIQAITDPVAQSDRLAEVQAILASKVSVEPRSLETYTHLGGTALMLLRQIKANAGAATSAGFSAHAAAARPLIETTLRYSRDVAASQGQPDSAWVKRLEEIEAEAQRISKDL